MTMLTKIGNSQGIRIPKPLIKQANLDGANIEFEVLEEGLLLKPTKNPPRDNWDTNIDEVIASNQNIKDESYLNELLDDSDLEDFGW